MTQASIQYLVHPLGVPVRVLQRGVVGAPIVLVHGLGSHAEIWAKVGEYLAERGFRCYALDLPGHGLSHKGPGFDYTATGYSSMLHSLLGELGLERVHIVGSSLGGLYAMKLATSYPERALSLTVVGGVGLEPLAPERTRWTTEYLKRMGREDIRARLINGVSDPNVIEEAFVEEAYRMNNSRGAHHSFAEIGIYYRDHINSDMQLDRLIAQREKFPILLLWGEEDTLVSYEGARKAFSSLQNAAFAALKKTKHIPQLERPAVVAQILEAYMIGRNLQGLALEGVEIQSSTKAA